MAVTVTVSKIDITSGTETLASVYTAVAGSGSPGVMTENTINKEYTINGNVELEISSGATLNITNASYEDGYLSWGSLTAHGTRFDNQGTFTCTAPGFTIDLDANNGNYNYIYNYRTLTLTGTQAKPIIIAHYYRLRFYPREGAAFNMNWVTFNPPSSYSTSGAAWDFQTATAKPTGTFQNILVTGVANSSYVGIFIYGNDLTGMTFDNVTCVDTRYGIYAQGVNVKLTNSDFSNTYFGSFQQYSNGSYLAYNNQYTDDGYGDTLMNQPKTTIEDSTFTDCYDSSGTEYGVGLTYGGVIKIKNCTFRGVDDALAIGIHGHILGRILLQGGIAGQTFTNVTSKLGFSAANNQGYYEVYELALTVNDSGGSPLQYAHVTIHQKEGHETHHFTTDANGQIKDLFGDDPVFVYREILSNTPTYDIWSDGNGNLVHQITIAHPDYQIDTREVAFDQNRSITAQLTVNAVGVTSIYDSTLYDTTIY